MQDILGDLSFTYWTWFIATLIFLGLEMILPGIVFLWLAIAAAVVGGVVFLLSDMTWEMQITLFTIFSILSIVLGRKHISDRGGIETEEETLNKRGEALIGRTVTVAVAIRDGYGKVKVGDTLWSAAGSDADAGAQVKVTAIDGNTLSVE